MNDSAAAKIKIIRNSLRCFGCGLLGLLPLAGIPFLFLSLSEDDRDAAVFFAFLCLTPTLVGILFAFLALILSGYVRIQQKKQWNPARPYSLIGLATAAIGIGVAFVIVTVITYRLTVA